MNIQDLVALVALLVVVIWIGLAVHATIREWLLKKVVQQLIDPIEEDQDG